MDVQSAHNVFQTISKRKCSFEDDFDKYLCKRKKYILFERGDFESAFYLTPATKFVLLKIQKNEPQKAKDKT